VGLESPIISSGSAIGSSLGRYLRLNYKQITLLLACGAAGGISAIFNTPVAGIVFALEVLLLDLTRFSLIPLLMASASGAITTRLLLKEEILFHFIPIDPFYLADMPYYVLLGLLAGLLSCYFSRVYLYMDKQINRFGKLRYRFAFGASIVGLLVFLFPALRGEGYASIKLILSGKAHLLIEGSPLAFLGSELWTFILFFVLLIMLKVVATSATINAGGIGGIFAPSAFTGAALGFLFVMLISQLGISSSLSASNFTLVGMASLLSGVLHAPLTSLFLITEITSGYQLIVPLMISGAISYLISKYIVPNSIITHQLAKRGRLITHHKDKAVLKFMQLRSVIETNLSKVPYNAKLGELVDIIAHSKRSVFPVLDEKGILMGIIHLDNVREIMFDKSQYDTTPVGELMVRPEAQVMEKDTMEEVVQKFNETGAWNLPVTREDGYYLGHISKSMLFEEYRKRLVDISAE
jgi:CIC family chloride channel protein